jgi:hypothetical protein
MKWDATVERGMSKMVDERTWTEALERFEHEFYGDPHGASRRLMHAVLDPIAVEQGKPSWVEMTPPNIAKAPMLLEVFPDAKFIHVMRDGRDVAASVVRLPWGPSTHAAALRFWRDSLREADEAARRLPADRLLVLQLERLVGSDRFGSYRRLLDFLEVEDEPAIRSFFDTEVTPERAHIGRWRHAGTPTERLWLRGRYELARVKLRAAGVTCVPGRVRRADARLATDSDVAAAAQIDPWADGRARDA